MGDILNSLLRGAGSAGSGNAILNVISLKLYETGTYQDPMKRAYTTNADSNNLEELGRSLMTTSRAGANVSAASLASVASNILKPGTRPQGSAQILNGWDHVRYRFTLTIDLTGFRSKQSRRKVLTGYTDGPRAAGGHLDMDMLFHVNSNIEVRDSVNHTERGSYTETNVTSVDQLLVGKRDVGPRERWRGVAPNTEYSLRPTDLMTTIGTRYALNSGSGFDGYQMGAEDTYANHGQDILESLTGQRSGMGGRVTDAEIHNVDSDFTMGACNSSRRNLSSASYLSRMLTGIRDAELMSDQYADDEAALYDIAAGSTKETGTEDTVFTAFGRLCEFKNEGTFTTGTLLQIDPDIDSKTSIYTVGGPHAMFHNTSAMNTSDWRRADQATIVATTATNSIPGILIDKSVAVATITYTNMCSTPGGDLHVAILGTEHAGVDEYMAEEAIRVTIFNEVIPSLTSNGAIDIWISIEVDVNEEVRITVQMEGDQQWEFAAPIFADREFTPMITSSRDALDNMASDVLNITSNIKRFGGNEATRSYRNTVSKY